MYQDPIESTRKPTPWHSRGKEEGRIFLLSLQRPIPPDPPVQDCRSPRTCPGPPKLVCRSLASLAARAHTQKEGSRSANESVALMSSWVILGSYIECPPPCTRRSFISCQASSARGGVQGDRGGCQIYVPRAPGEGRRGQASGMPSWGARYLGEEGIEGCPRSGREI